MGHQHAFRAPRGSLALPNTRPRLGCALLFLSMFVAGAVALVLVTFSMWMVHSGWEVRAQSYARTRGCRGESTFRSSGAGCVWRRATVVRADVEEDDGGDEPAYSYFLTLRVDGGAKLREQIPRKDDWASVSMGAVLR